MQLENTSKNKKKDDQNRTIIGKVVQSTLLDLWQVLQNIVYRAWCRLQKTDTLRAICLKDEPLMIMGRGRAKMGKKFGATHHTTSALERINHSRGSPGKKNSFPKKLRKFFFFLGINFFRNENFRNEFSFLKKSIFS